MLWEGITLCLVKDKQKVNLPNTEFNYITIFQENNLFLIAFITNYIPFLRGKNLQIYLQVFPKLFKICLQDIVQMHVEEWGCRLVLYP